MKFRIAESGKIFEAEIEFLDQHGNWVDDTRDMLETFEVETGSSLRVLSQDDAFEYGYEVFIGGCAFESFLEWAFEVEEAYRNQYIVWTDYYPN